MNYLKIWNIEGIRDHENMYKSFRECDLVFRVCDTNRHLILSNAFLHPN